VLCTPPVGARTEGSPPPRIQLAPGLAVQSGPESTPSLFETCTDGSSVWFSRDSSLWQRALESDTSHELLRVLGAGEDGSAPALIGPVMGIDGRLYFSVDHRAATLKLVTGPTIDLPSSGAILS